MKRLIFAFIIFANSCQVNCRLDEKQRLMLQEVHKRFNDYCSVENIPCETYYINIKLNAEENSEITSKVHEILYNREEKVGWLSLHIYDKDNQFLLSHNINGKRSKKVPNW